MVHELPKDTVFARLRRDRGLTQAELADRIGTSQPQIERLEKGYRIAAGGRIAPVKMTVKWAKLLAPVLECHWLELMDEAPPPALSEKEAALVDIYRGLAEQDRETVYRVADAIAETAGQKIKAGGRG